MFRPLTQELARRGHELVILTPDPAFPKGQTPENITEIGFHDMAYDLWREGFVKLVDGENDDFHVIDVATKLLGDIFDKVLYMKEVKDLIKSNQTFNLIFTEACATMPLVMSHVFKVPVIQISSLGSFSWNNEVIGTPNHPVIYPELIQRRLNNLTLWEKIYTVYADLRMRYIQSYYQDFENSIARKHFGPDIPTISELANNVHMLFLNQNPVWEGNRPTPPGVIHMFGLHQNPQKELPKVSYFDDF